MNDTSATSAPGASLLPEGTAAITTAHLIVIAILAIVVIAGILWGIRLKRTRVQAAKDVRSNAVESGMPPAAPSAEPDAVAPVPVPAPAVPVAPAPPPIADTPAMGVPPQFDHTTPEPLAPEPFADEPIAAAAPLDASPASEAAAPAPAAAPASLADGPVTHLKGLGPKVAARLGELGIATIGQMAALDDDAARDLDAQLGNFTGRMARDRWIEQARLLAAGDKAGFEAAFGRL